MATKKKTKLKTPTIALIIAIIVLVIVMLFGTSGQTAKFFAPQQTITAQKTTPATTNEVQQPLDLVPGTIIEYSANFKMYVVFIRAKNLGAGSVKLSKQNPIQLEMSYNDGANFLKTNSGQCAVLDAKLQVKQDQTIWGANEYLDCNGIGVASTDTKFTFKVDTTNIVAESNETNNELVIGS
jgi:uncharacterized lipoprotein YbaY